MRRGFAFRYHERSLHQEAPIKIWEWPTIEPRGPLPTDGRAGECFVICKFSKAFRPKIFVKKKELIEDGDASQFEVWGGSPTGRDVILICSTKTVFGKSEIDAGNETDDADDDGSRYIHRMSRLGKLSTFTCVVLDDDIIPLNVQAQLISNAGTKMSFAIQTIPRR